MQHVTSFTMFDSYDVALFTLQTRDFEKIQDGPQCVKRCIVGFTYGSCSWSRPIRTKSVFSRLVMFIQTKTVYYIAPIRG